MAVRKKKRGRPAGFRHSKTTRDKMSASHRARHRAARRKTGTAKRRVVRSAPRRSTTTRRVVRRVKRPANMSSYRKIRGRILKSRKAGVIRTIDKTGTVRDYHRATKKVVTHKRAPHGTKRLVRAAKARARRA